MTKRIFIIISAFLVIGSLLGCNLPTAEVQETSPPEVIVIPETETPPVPPPEPSPVGPKDCGTDFDCFITLAASCEPASVSWINPLDFFGAITTTTLYQELRGYEDDRCVYYLRTDMVEVSYSDEMKQQMLDNGSTEEQIEEQRSLTEDAAQQAGYDDTCLFTTNDLVALLTRWQQGTFSMDDYDVAECSGKIFGE